MPAFTVEFLWLRRTGPAVHAGQHENWRNPPGPLGLTGHNGAKSDNLLGAWAGGPHLIHPLRMSSLSFRVQAQGGRTWETNRP